MLQADGAKKGRLRAQYEESFKIIHSEKLGEMAAEFDRVHSVHRALEVGALHRIIPPASLRPYLIGAVERGIEKELQSARPSRKNLPMDDSLLKGLVFRTLGRPLKTASTGQGQAPELVREGEPVTAPGNA